MVRRMSGKTWMSIGIIFLVIGTSCIPPIRGDIGKKTSGILLGRGSNPANVTITDYIGDVCSLNYTTQETSIITSHPDIDVVNLDIVQTTFTRQEALVTLSVQVVGQIENRGHLIDFYNGTVDDLNFVEYDIFVSTSEQDYTLSYCNLTGQLSNGNETVNLTSSDFSVVGDTLLIWFSVMSPQETYESMSTSSMFVKMNLSSGDLSELVYLADLAPNPPLEIMKVSAPQTGFVGKTVQFTAIIIPFTGLPPYTYQWDFGDQGTSTALNPTHVYSNPGVYLYAFSVTDATGAVVTDAGLIVIYAVKKTFVFGNYINWTSTDGLTTVDVGHLWTLQFKPFKLELMTAPGRIRFSEDWVGFRTKQFMVGIFDIVLEITDREIGE